ncbi:MAG: EpsI family protein [Gemmatimonadales bacterium]|nr:EpsI family protein [Gemmatimonadales bacterium]
MIKFATWLPALILASGVGLDLTVGRQNPTPLREPLSALPDSLVGRPSRELKLTPAELKAAGVSSYFYRSYGADSTSDLSVYVGFYEMQTRGKTIHSPKNCLPGSGWEALGSKEILLDTPLGKVPVNRYVIANKNHRALVYYWYQGRGRISANEYRVKWELIRDAAFRRRTDEALVRIVVPAGERDPDDQLEQLAQTAARALVVDVGRVLPE